MATFVSDTFTDTSGTNLASHTGETGATWTAHPNFNNGLVISNANRLRTDGTASIKVFYASGAPAGANYTVSADFTVVSAAGHIGVVARLDTTASTYYRLRLDAGLAQFQLHKVVSGTATLLGTYNNGSTAFAVTLSCDGDQIAAIIDSVTRIGPVTDSAITAANKAGVYGFSFGTDSTGTHLDNFAAVDIGGGGGGLSIPVAMHHYAQHGGFA